MWCGKRHGQLNYFPNYPTPSRREYVDVSAAIAQGNKICLRCQMEKDGQNQFAYHELSAALTQGIA